MPKKTFAEKTFEWGAPERDWKKLLEKLRPLLPEEDAKWISKWFETYRKGGYRSSGVYYEKQQALLRKREPLKEELFQKFVKTRLGKGTKLLINEQEKLFFAKLLSLDEKGFWYRGKKYPGETVLTKIGVGKETFYFIDAIYVVEEAGIRKKPVGLRKVYEAPKEF